MNNNITQVLLIFIPRPEILLHIYQHYCLNPAMICAFIVMKCEFYWGYKNHVLVDCISGLPIYELTTTAEVADSSVALDILAKTHNFLPVSEYTFLADKGYDVKKLYNQVSKHYNGECIIPLNRRNTKDTKLLPVGVPACEAGLAMNRDGRCYDQNRIKQKFCHHYAR